jgi:vacuolar-type H+-ATPase subunit I/STV1
MAKLENGDFEGARETLTGLKEGEEDQGTSPDVAFALGVLKLLEMENVERMRGCRDYFQAFADNHPQGPYRENAERIVQVLNSHIRRTQREQTRIKELARQVSEQEKVIQNLQYKIEKLEEIHRETEQKRHLLDGK